MWENQFKSNSSMGENQVHFQLDRKLDRKVK